LAFWLHDPDFHRFYYLFVVTLKFPLLYRFPLRAPVFFSGSPILHFFRYLMLFCCRSAFCSVFYAVLCPLLSRMCVWVFPYPFARSPGVFFSNGRLCRRWLPNPFEGPAILSFLIVSLPWQASFFLFFGLPHRLFFPSLAGQLTSTHRVWGTVAKGGSMPLPFFCFSSGFGRFPVFLSSSFVTTVFPASAPVKVPPCAFPHFYWRGFL